MALDDSTKGKSPLPEEYHWSRQQVMSLISTVEEFFEDFYDCTKKKKTIWQEIGEKMQNYGFNCNGVDCDKKWRNLKATYMKVLQKQIHGDSNYRFEYFAALHHILGKEIDPLGMREQVLTQGRQILPMAGKSTTSDYNEISVDEGFVWVHSAVNALLDHIVESLSNICSPATIQERWEEISEQMITATDGYQLSSIQCQRKWEDMQNGYYYHQTKSEATGSIPIWPYFSRVKDIMLTLNIPVTVKVDLKTDRMKSLGQRRTQFRKRLLGGEYEKGTKWSILGRVRQLESKSSINRRLHCLEERVEEAQIQREAYNQTNNILTQMVSELRKINHMVETDNNYRYNNQQQQQQHTTRPGSPHQGIIIVEDFPAQQ